MSDLLTVAGLTRRFGGLAAVDNLALHVAEGELMSVIGPNGAGKTTLFNLVSGQDKPDEGSIRIAGDEVAGLPRSGSLGSDLHARSRTDGCSAISRSRTMC